MGRVGFLDQIRLDPRHPHLELDILNLVDKFGAGAVQGSPFHSKAMDDDFGDDADFVTALEAVERSSTLPKATLATPQQFPPNSTGPKVQQPTPQALPSRHTASSILVSTRQKGNPILTSIRSVPWEYSDIAADYVLGATTCALFLSLKYHRLHPEYIYTRIRALQGKYNLRIMLTMVDIQNHEESLRELSKTSLINNLTLILCWSAAEAGRYLELYKSFEHAKPDSIRAQAGTGYAEKLVEFITVPRSINKTDAVGLVSAFGSLRAAVNASEEEIGMVQGWGEKKVKRWCGSVREGFRVRRAEKRGVGERATPLNRQKNSLDHRAQSEPRDQVNEEARILPEITVPSENAPLRAIEPGVPDADKRPSKRMAEGEPGWEPGDDEEEALFFAMQGENGTKPTSVPSQTKPVASKPGTSLTRTAAKEPQLSEGIEAALAKLRNK